MAQLPFGIAILKIVAIQKARQQPALFIFGHDPLAFAKMLKFEASMESIALALEKIVIGGLRRAPASDIPLLAWPLACGSAVAARTRALEFTRGILRVEVPDAGWRAELQHLAPRYLAVINRYSTAAVNKIEFLSRIAK